MAADEARDANAAGAAAGGRTPPADRSPAVAAQARSHDALGVAQASLYHVLAHALVGREAAWAGDLREPLERARAALEAHAAAVTADDGLYAEIVAEAPWLARRVERVRRQLDRVGAQARDLEQSLAAVERLESRDAVGVRADVERMLTSLRDLMSQENELVYEQLNAPPALD